MLKIFAPRIFLLIFAGICISPCDGFGHFNQAFPRRMCDD